ncbi:MAG: hypothetical protein LBP39_01950 [Rickettsiales bacterium]|jgi:hypothetical protein|nr:hypothetical protein [Rickettsiales bacterium]
MRTIPIFLAGVKEGDLDEFLLKVLKIAGYRVINSNAISYQEERILDEEETLKTLIKPMKELFFMKYGKYKDIKTLEERWDIFLGEISKITGKKLYNQRGDKNKNIILFSGPTIDKQNLEAPFLMGEKKKEYLDSITYGDEVNFSLFRLIFEKFGNEMFLANRRKLREIGKKFEPRHPTSAPVEYTFLRWKKRSKAFQRQKKDSTITEEKIERMASINDINVFYRLLESYEYFEKGYIYLLHIDLIDSLWKESGNDKGYFKENGISTRSLKNPEGEDRIKIIQLAKNFIESYMSSEQVQKRLDSIIPDIEAVAEFKSKRPVRLILSPGSTGPVGSKAETIYCSQYGYENCLYFEPYKKTEVTDKILENIFFLNKLPIGSFVKRLIKEGGTNLTMDSIMGAQFARGANNAFIVTEKAIPVGNILSTSEMPEILTNVSKNADQAKRFVENNPIIPLTNEKPRVKLRNSGVLYVTGEYMLDQWKKKQKRCEVKDPEDRKEFTEKLYKDLIYEVSEYLNSTEKLDRFYNKLENMKEKYEKILENPEIYELDEIKIKHLKEAVYNDYAEDTEEEKKQNENRRQVLIRMNRIALKLQKLSLMESYIVMENMKHKEDMKKLKLREVKKQLSPITKRSPSVPPASNLRKDRFSQRRNSFVAREAELKKHEHGL